MTKQKSLKKLEKKFLTNRIVSDILNNVPLMRRVPCKLNNETNEKHQTVLLKVLTKSLPEHC